jgi:peptidoglycan/LPS O-acetylase OafA/YrhL
MTLSAFHIGRQATARMTHSEFLALRRFPALDGLRAVAATMVVIVHFGGPTWSRLTGWIGVHVFFVLSGFLITTLLLREEEARGRISLWRFYVRRLARIWPVYFVVLAVVAILELARGQYESSGLAGVMPYYLSFMGEYAGPGPHGQMWTLGIEQKFYLLWPLLAFPFMAAVRSRIAMAVTIIVSAGGAALLFRDGGPYVHYAVLAVGCLLACIAHSPTGWVLIRPLTRPRAATLIAAGFVLLQVCLPEVQAALGGAQPPLILVYSAGVVVLLASLLGGQGPIAAVLATRPMTAIGERSYSLYLVQGLAGFAVAAMVPALATARTLTAVAVWIVSLLIADLLHRWVELPFIAVGRHATRRRPPAVDQGELLAIPAPRTATLARVAS